MLSPSNKVRYLRWSLFLIVFLADRALKESLRLVVPPNDPESSVSLVNGVLYLYRAEAPYGLLTFLPDFDPLGQRIFTALAVGIFLFFLILWIRRTPDSQGGEVNSLILILSGVASNGVDLVLFGEAMKTLTWQVGLSRSFSLADLAVISGLCLLVLQRLKRRHMAKDRLTG